jgi:hypothetical protein
MTGERDRDGELTAFLLERGGRLGEGVFDAVDAAVRTTPQVRAANAELPTPRRRFILRPELAAAAVVLIAVGVAVGGYIGGLQTPSGAGGRSPTPSSPATRTIDSSPSAGPITTPVGMWTTIDVDGSPMTLSIANSGDAWSVSHADLRATACAGSIMRAQGPASWDGSQLDVEGSAGCDGSPADQPFAPTYIYDPAADTITELAVPSNLGPIDYVWSRGPTVADAFDGTWVATDIDGTELMLTFSDPNGLGRQVLYHDEHAQFCAVDPGYTASGRGTIGSVSGDGRFIRVTLEGSCDDGSSPRVWDHKYEFDWPTRTLIGPQVPLDIGGTRGLDTVTWSRP